MILKRKGANRIGAFLLVFAMAFTSPAVSGRAGSEVYADTDGTATVRIIDENNNAVITNAAISIESGTTTLGAVVAAACQAEGRTFELDFGYPATVGGVTLSPGYWWMSMLNDSGSAFNTGNFTDITANAGDRIVLYADSWPSVTSYSYFTVITSGGVSVMTSGAISYITGSVTLKLEKNVGGTVSPCTGTSLILTDPSGTVLSTANYDYGLPPGWTSDPITSNSGSIKIDLYGNCATADEAAFEKTFILSSNASGLVKPYCKIVMKAGDMTFSQPIDSTGFRPSDPMVVHTVDISGDAAAVIAGIRDESDIHAADYYDNDWVLGIAAAGLTPTQAEKDRYLTWALDLLANGTPSPAQKAKTAIALTALHIDARQVPNKITGEPMDLVKAVAASTPAGIDGTWAAPFMLSLYDLGNYEIPTDARVTREILIDAIMSAQGADYWGLFGTEGTGTVLPALAPYYNSLTGMNGISAASCTAITAALDDTIDYLSSVMGEYGGFQGFGDSLNANTQAIVLAGLHSLGIDTHTSSQFYKSASATDNLLSYRTADDKLGYSDNTSANDSASKQGLWALATYQNLNNIRSSNLYHFTTAATTYTDWPDADLLTGITVTPPTTVTYTYNAAQTAYTIDTAGVNVTAIYNGDVATATPVAIGSCTFSTIDRSAPGTQTVTVSYQGQTATFVVTVGNSDGTTPVEKKVSVRVRGGGSVIAASSNIVIQEGVTTALDVMKTALDNAGKSYVIKNGGYVAEINGIGEFTQGENSGWLYSVNGNTPSATAASDYRLSDGDSVLWYYTLDYTKDPSSSAWSKTETEALAAEAGQVTASTKVTASMDASGKASAQVSAKDISTAASDAAAAAAKAGSGTAAVVKIEVTADRKANAVEMSIPKAAVAELNKKVDILTVATPIADLSFDKASLKTLGEQTGGEIRITTAKVDTGTGSNISEEIKAQIGDRPVFEFSVTSGGNPVSEFGGTVNVSIPYTPAEGENTNAIVIYYINSKGELELVESGVYDSKTKRVTFNTTHFSTYAVGYNPGLFTDISGHWAKGHIEYLAARELIRGMTDITFAPNSNITRAQFVQILANMSQGDLSGYSPPDFKDVKENAWYANAVAWGVKNGITNGTGGSTFSPNDNITRQDMAVMLAKYGKNADQNKLAEVNDAVTFADDGKIAAYAKDAVTKMQKSGIISGVKNPDGTYSFYPSDKATRAEAAAMIANYMK